MQIKMKYNEEYTKVYDSYKYDADKLADEIIKTRYKDKLSITRDHTSYAREIRGHNRLYKLGLFKSHTKDVDLEEHNSKLMEVVWRIIGG